MTPLPPSWPPSQPPWPHGLETESRLTRLEVRTEDHGEALEKHETRHDGQDVWNKGFTVALAGLAAGVAHSKAGDWIEVARAVLGLLSK